MKTHCLFAAAALVATIACPALARAEEGPGARGVPAGADAVETESNVGLWAAGSAVLALSQASAFSVALTGSTFGQFEAGEDPPSWGPMFVPLVGPFIAIETTHAEAGGAALLVANGVGQIAGVAMIIAGVLDLSPVEGAILVPAMGPEGAGAVLQGTF
jgi:hypothetical protein